MGRIKIALICKGFFIFGVQYLKKKIKRALQKFKVQCAIEKPPCSFGLIFWIKKIKIQPTAVFSAQVLGWSERTSK